MMKNDSNDEDKVEESNEDDNSGRGGGGGGGGGGSGGGDIHTGPDQGVHGPLGTPSRPGPYFSRLK